MIMLFQDIYDQSTPLSPVIFILSPGADPANDVIKLADRMGFGGTKLKLLALGYLFLIYNTV
jgi:dynein heavy chain, axonemal